MQIPTPIQRRFSPIAVAAAVIFAACAASAPAAIAAPVPVVALSLQPAAGDDFQPVSQVPAQEQLPAAPMVMIAYAVVWVMTVGFVFSVWRRLDKVEKELRDVERRVGDQVSRS